MNGEIAIRDGQEPATSPATFRLLGPVQIAGAGRRHPAGPGQQQRLLVKLLAAKGTRVANDELMAAIWDEVPGPGATLEALYHLVGAVRRTLAGAGLEDALHNTNGTYWLDVPPAHVDVHVFHALTEHGRTLARNGDQRAVARLEDALRLCHGEPLAGLPGRWVDGYRHTLAEEIRAAQLALYQTALRHGESRERLPGLSTLLRERPDDELVAWLYMHALYRAGQPTRALEVKSEFSAQLKKTTGMGYGRALNHLCERIQAKDGGLLMPEALDFPGGEAGARPPHPGSRDGQGQEHEEPVQSPANADGPAPDNSAASQRPEPAAAGPYLVFNGPVNGQNAVFGTQINHGGAR
jgi:DNA-binding SARP family transcriptional activator